MSRYSKSKLIIAAVTVIAAIGGVLVLFPYVQRRGIESNYARGENYLSGTNGAPVDYAQALKCFQVAAEAGHAPSMAAIGEMYFHGMGVNRNQDTATQWFQKAANAGDPRAMTILGCLNLGMWPKPHKEGEPYELNHDDAAAFSWFQKAADKGDPIAMANLSRMYIVGEGVSPDLAKAREWAQKASAAGNKDGVLSPIQFP